MTSNGSFDDYAEFGMSFTIKFHIWFVLTRLGMRSRHQNQSLVWASVDAIASITPWSLSKWLLSRQEPLGLSRFRCKSLLGLVTFQCSLSRPRHRFHGVCFYNLGIAFAISANVITLISTWFSTSLPLFKLWYLELESTVFGDFKWLCSSWSWQRIEVLKEAWS